jgi:hypothetical protein
MRQHVGCPPVASPRDVLGDTVEQALSPAGTSTWWWLTSRPTVPVSTVISSTDQGGALRCWSHARRARGLPHRRRHTPRSRCGSNARAHRPPRSPSTSQSTPRWRSCVTPVGATIQPTRGRAASCPASAPSSPSTCRAAPNAPSRLPIAADHPPRYEPGRRPIDHRTPSRYPRPDPPPGLLRLSVGCEHPDDSWRDLQQALTP